ncbi:hypothetical protein IEC97_19950 [Neobacillus cucumis]|uniref:hypothetical protein n=1 Tax=Neobacillus cucumis TaxID=1740721 RepID=UPI0018DF52D6|nr:hypothetical protein [Neobacillus cucumis]MBI0579639.1 hypothetical protein [Neobacillus cucumis]
MGMVRLWFFAGFADSGTMTTDFTRWSKNGKEAVMASITAFPVGNFVAQIVGGIVVATGVIPNAVTNGGNILMVLTGHGSFLSLVSVLFVFIRVATVIVYLICKAIVQRNASLVFEDSDKSVHSGD